MHRSTPAGCARCVREAARASASRANLFSALLSKNFFRKSPSVLPRHPIATVGRQRGASVLTASTITGLDPGSPCRMTLGIVANVDCGHVRYQIVECRGSVCSLLITRLRLNLSGEPI